MKSNTRSRLKTYCELNSEIFRIRNKDLIPMIKQSHVRTGWGSNHVLKLSGKKVFIKKIPLTHLEYESAFDTSNLYRLPMFYHYGVGSAGFGVFRELSTHIKTTNWVLAGEIENFPLMYHYRIVPRIDTPIPIDAEKHAAYVQRWNGNRSIDKFIRERNTSSHELLIFLEYFPTTLGLWLKTHMSKFDAVSEQLFETTEFLNGRGILHFDLHVMNVVLDDRVPFITDFGLALDRDFVESAKERD